jgi:transaldolase
MASRAEQLLALGQSVWLDFIRRGHLVSGEFDRLVRDSGVVGVTSNPTIFQQAIAKSSDYDAALQSRIASGLEGPALFESLAVEDVQMACDRLRSVHEKSGGLDGRVSIEVSPRLADDTHGSVAEGLRLHRSVARDNLYVKVPATPAGLPAITALLAEGVCVNVTLIFSIGRYEQVMDAWLAGLEERAKRGQPIDRLFSVASFFVSRVDSKVDPAIDLRLETMAKSSANHAELASYRGRTAVANARVAYRRFKEVVADARYAALVKRGAPVQRPLWASTSTKNPAYRDVLYVEELIGPDTVNTMPPQTLEAFNDHGVVEARLEHDVDGARRMMERLVELGVPLGRLIDELEPEGVAAFAKSYESLIETLESKRKEMVGSGGPR